MSETEKHHPGSDYPDPSSDQSSAKGRADSADIEHSQRPDGVRSPSIGDDVRELPQKDEKKAEAKPHAPLIASPAAPAVSPPPNGGRLAWTQVLCGFLLFCNTFGIITSFGVFQTYYESGPGSLHRSSSDISWIGSIQAFLLQFSGLIAGPIFDRGYVRSLLSVGTFAIVFGHMMLSIAKTYWQVLLAQGFCVGLGMGCLYVPSISILPAYFTTRLGLAIGLASSGSAVGGVIYPIIMQRLIKQVGFAWAVRVVGFVALVALSVPIALMRTRFRPAKARAMIDWSVFTDLPFIWFAVATAIGFMGLTAFQIYFAFYAEQQELVSTSFAFSLVSIYNALSALGRIVPNAISDKVGQFNILAPCVLLTGVVYFCTIATHARGPMIGITILGGFFLGVLTALPPVCFAVLTKDKTKIGTRIGTGFAIIAFGVLAAGPAAGAILQRSKPLDWTGLFTFSGTAMLVGGLMYSALRFAKFGLSPFIKA